MSIEIKNQTLNISGVSLLDLLNDKFLRELIRNELNIEPISLVLALKEKGKTNAVFPIILSHGSKKDIENKILNIMTDKTESSDKLLEILETIGE